MQNANNTLIITAKTLLKKDFGFNNRVHPLLFETYFHMDSRKFKRIHVFKQGACRVTAWMLLDLLSQVIPEKYFGDASKVQLVYHSSVIDAYPALKIKNGGKHYRLDHAITVSWLANENVLDLLAFWQVNRKLFKEDFEMPIQQWNFWVEDLYLEDPKSTIDD